jgi:hypothetical protein
MTHYAEIRTSQIRDNLERLLNEIHDQFANGRIHLHAYQAKSRPDYRHVAPLLDHPALDHLFDRLGAPLKQAMVAAHYSRCHGHKEGLSLTENAEGHDIPFAQDWLEYLDDESTNCFARNAVQEALAEMAIAHMRQDVTMQAEMPAVMAKLTSEGGHRFFFDICSMSLVTAHNTQTMTPRRIPGGLAGALCSRTTGDWWTPELQDGELNFAQHVGSLSQRIRPIAPAEAPKP